MTRSNLPRQQLVNRALARKWNEQTTTGERERRGWDGITEIAVVAANAPDGANKRPS